MARGHRKRQVAGLLAAALALIALFAAWTSTAAAKHARGPAPTRIVVVSNRADLISGGDALVKVLLPAGTDARDVTVTAGHRDVTDAFEPVPSGALEGLVTGLRNGDNVLTARLADGSGARITVTNHPNGGPVLAGPQLQPWTCEDGAVNKKCDKPPQFDFFYKSTDPRKSTLQPYDPKNPPDDVATTTTDRGVTVPFIVRVETGYQDRDQYKIGTLFDPDKPWTALAPQKQFNHKLVITHGVSCGVSYKTGGAPSVISYNPANLIGDDNLPSIGADSVVYALGKGFAVMSTALDYSGHNCNLPLQAESLVMAKEYLIEHYGTLRYTIGTGCSGGSLAQQWIANAYPGVYQGILPTCSFPDAWSTASQFLDYHLLLAYFTDTSKWGPGVVWLPNQMADVEDHISIVNSEVSDQAQWHVAVPTDHCSGISDEQRYDPATNPGGVRCTITDAAINVFGPNPPATWYASEKKVGHGFAVPPIDNVGVQYGLDVLRRGLITPAQFVDLNEKVGGVDIDTNPVANRIDTGGAQALGNAYRSGMINEGNNLDRTAIIDCRGPDPGLFHDSYRAFALRARLDRENGTHANQSIWEGPAPIVGDTNCGLNSFIAMDKWLGAVASDDSSKPLTQKIVDDRPANAGDSCFNGSGVRLTDGICPQPVVPVYGTPRMVAGDAISTDTNKCQLKPLDPADYNVTFTDAQWAQLQATFPTGVCDFSKPGVDQQGTVPWLTYQDAAGKVIYGGKRLGKPPRSRPIR